MQVFFKQSLAYIAVPKTGTTSIEKALRPKAMLAMPGRYKHMTAGQFKRRIAPFLRDNFELEPQLFAVMRHPEDQIRSWYKYRRRPALVGKPEYSGDLSFEEYVHDVLKEDRPPHARVGSQWNMLSRQRKELLVHHLFAYEAQPLLLTFLEERFDDRITLPLKNISPMADAELEPATRRKLKAAFAPDFDLHARLTDAGGYLCNSVS